MSKNVSFVVTEEWRNTIDIQAATRGLTASQLAKMLMHDYIKKSPTTNVVNRMEAKILELDRLIAEYTVLCKDSGVATAKAQHSLAQGDSEGGSE